MFLSDNKIKGCHIGNQIIKAIYKGATVIWKRVVDTAITLLRSSAYAGDPCYAYNINATIYENIDMSLYKGIQFYVDKAYVNALHSGGHTSISVVAYEGETNVGSQTIASCANGNNGEQWLNSNAGKTLTLEFTSDEGMADLKVVGSTDGTPSSKAEWALSNAVLLAR